MYRNCADKLITSDLHHEPLDALEHELGALHAPRHRHLLAHVVRQQQREGQGCHVAQRRRLQDISAELVRCR